jgi:hypothetical protein
MTLPAYDQPAVGTQARHFGFLGDINGQIGEATL